jgi:H+-transporting ATPase
MPAVLSVTMAVGALALSKLKAIVSRLESIEEMAGMDILCSDKTGTLTQNKLTLGDPMIFEAEDARDLILAAALASKAEDQDAIDLAVIGGLQDRGVLNSYGQLKFVPFDPVSKRTEATIKDNRGTAFKVTKGAPQVILELAQVDPDIKAKAGQAIGDFAA